MTGAVRGVLAGVLLVLSGFVVLFSWTGLNEVTSPESFPGIRDNHAPIVVIMLGIGLLPPAAALWLVRRLGRAGRAMALCGAVAVLALTAPIVSDVAPMLHCWEADGIAQQPDGSYKCYDRSWF
ncbi:hypothetical protein GCM10020367_21730 [Streptomyces sannanensis]|uniref:DUF998 domain-containing protein n=1 Tax=Streptomyces sannanensis TaxID=285536 RepID=A0ABP6S990_9ACTN